MFDRTVTMQGAWMNRQGWEGLRVIAVWRRGECESRAP